MSVKKETSQIRSVELEVELPGTPEQVWQAIATGPGISAWFVPCEVEEREGGALVFHLGPGMDSKGTVTAWEPPRRFALEEPGWSEGAAPLGSEFVVEARDGGTCKVRLVHSLFATSDKWDDELEGMKKGWVPFFEVLRTYLARFAGQRAASLRPTGFYGGSVDDGWEALKRGLNLQNVGVGERCASDGTTAPRLAGVVQHVGGKQDHHDMMLLLDAPSTGVALLGAYAWGGKVNLAVSLYFYGSDADEVAAREAAAWDAWMSETFPAPAG